MPKIKLTDAYLCALPKAPGKDVWHSDTALLGFVAVQRSRGKITFRIRTDKNHSLNVGTWSTTLTSADARELAKNKLREHLVKPVAPHPKITLGKYVVKALILTAMNTGLRQGELFNLTWEDYADAVITARTRKTRGSRLKVRRVTVPAVAVRSWRHGGSNNNLNPG
jgi:integrase